MTLSASFAATLLSMAAPGQIDWNHPYGNPVELIDGGLCVGLAWVKLQPGEKATVDYGPDFNVYRVHGPADAEWGAYSGFAGQSTPDRQHPLLRKDGVTLYRGTGHQGFDGYVIAKETTDHRMGEQNHFFGTMFKDSAADAAFFKRVTFGLAANTKCKTKPQR